VKTRIPSWIALTLLLMAATVRPVEAQQQAPTVPVEVLERYAGEYEMTPTVTLTVRLDGAQLTARPTGQAEAVLDPQSETRFEVRGVGVELEFVTDEAGVVNVVVRQAGQEFPGRRRVSP
jgi:hypothetical protein